MTHETHDHDPEIENSPLSGLVTRDGITVSVEIYRVRNSTNGWSLEVVDAERTGRDLCNRSRCLSRIPARLGSRRSSGPLGSVANPASLVPVQLAHQQLKERGKL